MFDVVKDAMTYLLILISFIRIQKGYPIFSCDTDYRESVFFLIWQMQCLNAFVCECDSLKYANP